MEFLTNSVSSLLSFIFLLGVVIFVHEAGHMLVAKAFGVRVLTFSLGFGKRLWGFTRGETDYRVAAIPLGGYVKMSGELAGEEGDDPADFLNKPRWQRFLVYLAGPAMNAVLSVFVVAIVFMVGIAVPASQDIAARVGYVIHGSPAEAAGLESGDQILEVNGESVELWDEVQALLMTSNAEPVQLRVERGSESFEAQVTPSPIPGHHLSDTGGILPEELLTVTELVPDKPAIKAGLQTGDILRTMDHQPVASFPVFVEYISARPGQEILLDVERDGASLVLAVTPENLDGLGRIGLRAGNYQRYGFGKAFVESVRHNIWIVRQTGFVLSQIFTRRISAEKAVSGPIEIATISGQAAREGFRYLLYLMGVISISIGLMNLLPIPVLDGGQIFILGIEGIIRRDLPLKAKEVINQVGFVLIMLIMLSVIFFDLKKKFLPGLMLGL